MAGRFEEALNQWGFESVQEFWDSEVWGWLPSTVRQGSFEGKVLKGIVDNGKLRELQKEDVESGTRPNALIVSQVQNLERPRNWNRSPKPPPRTGRFSAFMDEVEEVAARGGCQYVWVEKVANEFLPEKLEARGYHRLNDPEGFPNPDYLKIMPRPD